MANDFIGSLTRKPPELVRIEDPVLLDGVNYREVGIVQDVLCISEAHADRDRADEDAHLAVELFGGRRIIGLDALEQDAGCHLSHPSSAYTASNSFLTRLKLLTLARSS